MKILTLLIFLISFTSEADIYFAKVLRVDNHNIITVDRNNKKTLLRFAYLRTPVINEFQFKEVNSFIKKEVLGKWLRISELPGHGSHMVKRAIIRGEDNSILNVKLASNGMGYPVPLEKPPQAIIKASQLAYKNSLGIWSDIDQLKASEKRTNENAVLSILENATDALNDKKSEDYQIFVGDKLKKTFSEFSCITKYDPKSNEFYPTKFVGLNKGYKFVSCLKPTNK